MCGLGSASLSVGALSAIATEGAYISLGVFVASLVPPALDSVLKARHPHPSTCLHYMHKYGVELILILAHLL